MKLATLIYILIVLSFSSTAQTSDTITYLQKSKLEWSDFKQVLINNDTTKGFFFSSTIQMKIVKINTWTGVTTFEAYGVYYPSLNWISVNKKNDKILDYFQLQYNISNSFAKQLEKEINSKKLNGAYKNKMDKIFKDFETRLNVIYQKMDSETLNGQNDNSIEIWKNKLKNGTLEN